jgi:soluble lytic murein transglycosylase-like protein
LLALLAIPFDAHAAVSAAPELAIQPDTTGPGRNATPTFASSVLVRLRESSQRILEPPDTPILRYTARYPVSNELATKIVEAAAAEGIDPELAFRLVRVESQFRARARGPGGSLGLTQLMPSTARYLDRSLRSEEDILEPQTNLRLGFRYLRNMIDRYGDVRLALLAYNRGPVAVDRALRNGTDPENGYSRRVLGSRPTNRYRGDGLLAEAR